jgi:uncharacterized protein with HEPN domain
LTQRAARLYLADMVQACEDVTEAVAGISVEAFIADKLRHKAVIRDLEVLGEAASQLPQEVRALAPTVPWRRIVGMRNKLIHGYSGLDLGIVHRAATVEIPALLPELKRMLRVLSGRSEGS